NDSLLEQLTTGFHEEVYRRSGLYFLAWESPILTLMGKICIGRRKDGSPCQAYSVPPSDFCWFHGAQTNPVKRQKHTEKVVEAAQELMQTLGAPQHTTPAEFVLQELYRTNGHILWLQERLLCDLPEDVAPSFWMFKRA